MFPLKETLIGGVGGLAWGVTFWLKTERDKDGKLQDFEFTKLVRTGIFSMVAGGLMGYAGKGLDLAELGLMVQALGSGAFGLLLDNISKIVWRRFGRKIAETLGFLG